MWPSVVQKERKGFLCIEVPCFLMVIIAEIVRGASLETLRRSP